MLRIIWSSAAETDLLDIVAYIWERNPKAAWRLYDAVRESVVPLSEHPYLFKRSQRLPGCRELLVNRNYAVLYRVEIDCVRVVRVVHAMRVHF